MPLTRTSSHAARIRLWRVALTLLTWLACTSVVSEKPAAAQNKPAASGIHADVPPQELKSNLQRILNGQEFQPEKAEKNVVVKALERARKMWEDFKKWLRDLFRTRAFAGGGEALITVLATLILLGLGWVIVRLFLDWSPGQARGQQARHSISAAEEAEAELVRDPDIWLKQAEEAAGKEDYRRAYRAVFLAIMLRLDQAGVLPYDRARTNGDYLRMLFDPVKRPFYELLVPLAHAFDARWYGTMPTQDTDYHAIRARYDSLPTLLSGPHSGTGSPGALHANSAGERV